MKRKVRKIVHLQNRMPQTNSEKNSRGRPPGKLQLSTPGGSPVYFIHEVGAASFIQIDIAKTSMPETRPSLDMMAVVGGRPEHLRPASSVEPRCSNVCHTRMLRASEREKERGREREPRRGQRRSASAQGTGVLPCPNAQQARERERERARSPRKPQNVGGPHGPGSLTSSSNPKEEESPPCLHARGKKKKRRERERE